MKYVIAIAAILAASPSLAADVLPLNTADIDAVMNECDADAGQIGARARLLAIKLSQANSEAVCLKADLAKATADLSEARRKVERPDSDKAKDAVPSNTGARDQSRK